MKASKKLKVFSQIPFCPLADRSERDRIAYCFMRSCTPKVRWLSMEERVPSDQGKLKPMDIPSTTFEVGSSLQELGEEVTKEISKCSNYMR
jgi:hypothetical protein